MNSDNLLNQNILPRLCFAASHIAVKDSYLESEHSVANPGSSDEFIEHIDWISTGLLRQRLLDRGFGVAEAMDTAQRFSIGWLVAKRLIEETATITKGRPLVAGASYDNIVTPVCRTTIIDAIIEQSQFIQSVEGIPVILPVSWLCETNATPSEYIDFYSDILNELDGPILLHWLGPDFAPNLKGYFPGNTALQIMRLYPDTLRGIKVSLLDPAAEIELRNNLLETSQVVFTGDDFNFPALIWGDDTYQSGSTTVGEYEIQFGQFSHALLGILDIIAEPVSRALSYLTLHDREAYNAIMVPCEQLSRHIFTNPTNFYKSGLAFVSWLADWQSNPMLLNHEEFERPDSYYRDCAALAVKAGLVEPHIAKSNLAQLNMFFPSK